MHKLSLTLALLLVCVLGTKAQTISSDYIDSIMEKNMEMMPQAGVAIGVIQNGKLVHAKGYGLASTGTKAKVDENTLFAIASNSKAFTTTALGMLVDEGKLEWKDKVVDIIPEFKMYDAYVTAEFNIQDLITHRSGLGLGAGDLLIFPDGNDFTFDDIIKSFQHQTPVSAFRTKYDYDNLLYIVAGEVIHRISGKPWDQFVEEMIMQPLHMNRTAALYNNLKSKENIASPHHLTKDNLVELEVYARNGSGFGAAGGIYSSVTDMSKWVIMHLNEGKYGDSLEHKIISHKNHDELWKAHTNMYFDATPTGAYKTHYRAYGLGFNLYDENGYTIVQHSGGLPGMLSMVTMIPELNAGIIVLTNSDPGGYSFVTMTNSIKDQLIGVDGPDWLKRIHNYINFSTSNADSIVNDVWQTVEKANTNQLNLNDYVGMYKDDWFGNVEIELKGSELWLSSKRSPKLTGQMFYYQANTFAIKWNYKDMECDAFAIFSLDEHGKAQSIRMKGISPKIDFSFDFQDLELERIAD
jgi:CubicO group peptidase (beta-lactamase class C family)